MADVPNFPNLTPDDLHAIQVLMAAHTATSSPFDNLSAREKSFVEASKAFTMIAGAGAVGLNMFAVSIAFMSKRVFHANDSPSDAVAPVPPSAPTPSPAAGGSGIVNVAQDWMLFLTFFCFLYTCCTAAAAHATVHRVNWVKKLAVMVYLEQMLLAGVCCLCYYMLTSDCDLSAVIWSSIGVFFAMAIPTHCLFLKPQ